MRLSRERARVFAWVLGLSAVLAASTGSQAQDVVYADGPVDPIAAPPAPSRVGPLPLATPPIPRTYSYYYDTLVQPAVPLPGRRPGREDLLADDRPRPPPGHALAVILNASVDRSDNRSPPARRPAAVRASRQRLGLHGAAGSGGVRPPVAAAAGAGGRRAAARGAISSRSSATGCAKISRLGDGSTGGVGCGTSCQRRRNP